MNDSTKKIEGNDSKEQDSGRNNEDQDIDKEEDEKSSYQTIELLNCFDKTKIPYNHNLIEYKSNRLNSPKVSFNISKEFIQKTIENNEESQNNSLQHTTENLMLDFEEKWQLIEKSKITKKPYNNDNRSNMINMNTLDVDYNKNCTFKFMNKSLDNSEKFEEIINSTSQNYEVLQSDKFIIQTENDIENLRKILRHGNYSVDRNKEINNCNIKNDEFIKIKNYRNFKNQSTKPSINSFLSNSKSADIKNNQEKFNQIKKLETVKIKDNNSNCDFNTNTSSINLKKRIINLYENIINNKETSTNYQNNDVNTEEQERSNLILKRYKDINSFGRNFDKILNDINPKIQKSKIIKEGQCKDNNSIYKDNSLFLKNSIFKDDISIKKNKNYLHIEKNLCLLNKFNGKSNIKQDKGIDSLNYPFEMYRMHTNRDIIQSNNIMNNIQSFNSIKYNKFNQSRLINKSIDLLAIFDKKSDNLYVSKKNERISDQKL